MYKFLSFDIQTITFQGVSRKYQRKLALAFTLGIWVGLTIFAFGLAGTAKTSKELEDVISMSALVCVLVGLFGGPFLPFVAARALFDITPLGVLYRNDQVVLERARAELLRIAKEVNFENYLSYSKINPDIRSKKSLLVMVHQKRGDLGQWVLRTRNLHQLANLVYQIFLVEARLQLDSQNGSSGPDL